MILYYVRWPNGGHPLTWASDKCELHWLLGKRGCAVDHGVLVKCLGDKPFAFDFSVDGGGDGGDIRLELHAADNATELCSACVELNVEQMESATQFFAEEHRTARDTAGLSTFWM
jgi:hypothetical protein